MADPSIGRGGGPADGAVRPELLVVGAATRDLDPTDPRGWRLGGTVSYAALAAARLGVRVRALIGLDAVTRHAHELDLLRDSGVEIAPLELETGPIFENVQTADRRLQLAHAASSRMPVTALPAKWRDARAVLLGPVAGEIDGEWAGALDRATFVALAWQGLLRAVVPGEPVATLPLTRNELVARADALLVSAEDVAAGGARLDGLISVEQQLFVTHGGHGALRVRRVDGRTAGRYVPPRPRRGPVDTTGAGDVFLAAYVAARLSALQLYGTDAEWRWDAVAAAAASLNVSARHLAGVPTLREVCAVLVTPPR